MLVVGMGKHGCKNTKDSNSQDLDASAGKGASQVQPKFGGGLTGRKAASLQTMGTTKGRVIGKFKFGTRWRLPEHLIPRGSLEPGTSSESKC